MKINKQVFFFVFSFLVLSLSLATPVAQALDYQLLEKIPFTNNIKGSDLPGYVSAIYKAALVIVTLSAVLMVSVGGFMYLTSAGNTASMGTAKGIIYDSLIGLVIALSAWLILYIINPDLVQISLKGLPTVTVTNAPAPSISLASLPTGSDSDLAKQILVNPNITLLPGGDCKSSSGVVSPLTSIQNIADGERADRCSFACNKVGVNPIGCYEKTKLSNTMLAAMLAVAKVLSYTVTSISGGPHSSSSAHYQGRAIDIDTSAPANKAKSQALMDAFVKAGAIAPNGTAGTSMCEDKNGKSVSCGPATTADHLHLIFPN
ncbi:MAG: hypothetical protein KBB77_01210 [Candidatus Moranbacteria bacterium]|nr:hypothetical protein [Candidatus Moranbacteria bacterium]